MKVGPDETDHGGQLLTRLARRAGVSATAQHALATGAPQERDASTIALPLTHIYASLMIAAGGNAKALSTFMGHANIAATLDLCGHLMPRSEAEVADLLGAFLARSATASSAQDLDTTGATGRTCPC